METILTWLYENYKKMVAAMAMGPLAEITRRFGHVLGSCLTYASIGQAVAKGQVPVEAVHSMYKFYKPGSKTLEGVLDVFDSMQRI